ncbi:MAG: DUF3604 domain-containing protein [Myxococcales bacterium]|nr:DUF3604 domain-containing protein [Myxococcales bacterium]
MSRSTAGFGTLVLVAWTAACSSDGAPPPQAASSVRVESAPRCADRDPLRQAYFGDLHVHTAISMDANMFGTRLRPADAYRFARGESLAVRAVGAPESRTQINRPLDFAAVTDHATGFPGVRLCTTPGSAVYDTPACEDFRGEIDFSTWTSIKVGAREIIRRNGLLRSEAVCGADGSRCVAATVDVWEETQRAAAQYNDASPECNFTTFVAYEYTATPESTKVHRNVIFRNDIVPAAPISYFDEPRSIELWRGLRRDCIDAGTGCDVLAIPHNPNLSNGQMFTVEYGDAETRAEQAEVAALRASMEPLAEMFQMKGDSECRNGMWNVLGATDELCDYEKAREFPKPPDDCRDGTGKGALVEEGCASRLDFVRYALIEGLREEERIGVNPYKFGFIASTDIHSGAPGPTEEYEYQGRVSAGNTPGGLVAVFAEENSRDALFRGLRRRETYGTSGTRIQARFFGAWNYPADLCDDPERVLRAYSMGVPMGANLPPRSDGDARPVFLLSALRDPGTAEHPGTALQRIQVVKGWADDEGLFHQAVYDVGGTPDNGADVDLDTCEPRGAGHDALCSVWRDPDFEPDRRSVYYARIVENPSCRSNQWQCLTAGEGAPSCNVPGAPKTAQERAWTSPIWYTPAS